MKRTLLSCAIGLLALGNSAQSAVYDVEVLPVNDLAVNAFARSIDESGMVIVTTQNLFNQPIDLTLINFDEPSFTDLLEDAAAAESGNFTDTDYINIINSLRANTANNVTFTQKLAEFRSMTYDGQISSHIRGFDQENVNTDGITFGNQVLARDSLNGSFIVGTSEDVFERLDYVDEDGEDVLFVINDFRIRAFVEVGNTTIPLQSPDLTLNGRSEAYAINSGLQVAGAGMISNDEVVANAIEFCENDEDRGDQPIEACLWRLQYPVSSNAAGILDVTAQMRPIVWTLDADGTVIDTQTYDLLIQPEEDQTGLFEAAALDINDSGIAVGFSDTNIPEATVFSNGETTAILDADEFEITQAIAINNNNWVAGQVSQLFSGIRRSKMFVTNLDASDVVIQEGFFPSSAVTVRDINNNNIVVGEAEFEALANGIRDKHAFMYEIDTDTFTDLNTLIACDAPYLLVDATGINDNNEIVVTARASVNSRNPLGQDVLNDAGEPITVDGAISLKLTPVPNGQPETCEDEESDIPDRQGASSGIMWSLILLLGVAIRRLRA